MTKILSPKIGVNILRTNPLYTDATLPTVGPQENMDFDLGDFVYGADSTQWMFVQASGAIGQYDWVGVDENHQAAKLTDAMASDGFFIGIAQVAFADDDGGWVVVRGSNIQGKLAASCAADVALYTTAVAGVLDDNATSTLTKIDGVVSVETITAATNAEIMFRSHANAVV